LLYRPSPCNIVSFGKISPILAEHSARTLLTISELSQSYYTVSSELHSLLFSHTLFLPSSILTFPVLFCCIFFHLSTKKKKRKKSAVPITEKENYHISYYRKLKKKSIFPCCSTEKVSFLFLKL
jgi:hypothetical protein